MKLVWSVGLLLCVARDLCGQGTVDFNNYSGTPILNQGVPVRRDQGYVAQLYWSPSPDGLYQAVGAPTTIGDPFGLDLPGYFGAGVLVLEALFPAGGLAYFEVRAWELAFGATWEQARAAPPMGGRAAASALSARFSADTGNPLGLPELPTDLGPLIPPFSFIPEPSLLTLFLVGGGTFWLFRPKRHWGHNT